MDYDRIDAVVAKVETYRQVGLVLCYVAYPFMKLYKLLTGQAWDLRGALAAFHAGIDASLWDQFSEVRDDFSVRECTEIKRRLFFVGSIFDDGGPAEFRDIELPPGGIFGELEEPTRPERRSDGRAE